MTMARPATPIRQHLRAAARQMLATQPHITSRDLLSIAIGVGIGRNVARNAVREMIRAGELCSVGAMRADGSRRPLATYALPTQRSSETAHHTPWALLALAITGPATAGTC